MIRRILPLLLAAAAVAGCSSRDDDLDHFIKQTEQEPPGGAQPLPEVKPYEAFEYTAQSMRSPFMPGGSGGSGPNVRPNTNRNREVLEEYALDTLKMVGTLSIPGKTYGLVQPPGGPVQRVLPGNYLGQSDGRITKIEPSKITITEIVPDGLGGFMERPAALKLNE